MMKLVLAFALVAAACADVSHLLRPSNALLSPFAPRRNVAVLAPIPVARHSLHSGGLGASIVRQSADITPEGNYQWAYETDNGIAAQEQGSLRASGPEAALVAQGNFAWTSPEGVPVAISYVADENGYQPQGDSLPTPPPVPAAILKALAWNEAHPEPAQGLQRRF